VEEVAVDEEVRIREVLGGGRVLALTGDRQLEVAPGDRESAGGWGAGGLLELTDSSEPAEYPLTILHESGEEVAGRWLPEQRSMMSGPKQRTRYVRRAPCDHRPESRAV
jgi:hypothetical protein